MAGFAEYAMGAQAREKSALVKQQAQSIPSSMKSQRTCFFILLMKEARSVYRATNAVTTAQYVIAECTQSKKTGAVGTVPVFLC